MRRTAGGAGGGQHQSRSGEERGLPWAEGCANLPAFAGFDSRPPHHAGRHPRGIVLLYLLAARKDGPARPPRTLPGPGGMIHSCGHSSKGRAPAGLRMGPMTRRRLRFRIRCPHHMGVGRTRSPGNRVALRGPRKRRAGLIARGVYTPTARIKGWKSPPRESHADAAQWP